MSQLQWIANNKKAMYLHRGWSGIPTPEIRCSGKWTVVYPSFVLEKKRDDILIKTVTKINRDWDSNPSFVIEYDD